MRAFARRSQRWSAPRCQRRPAKKTTATRSMESASSGPSAASLSAATRDATKSPRAFRACALSPACWSTTRAPRTRATPTWSALETDSALEETLFHWPMAHPAAKTLALSLRAKLLMLSLPARSACFVCLRRQRLRAVSPRIHARKVFAVPTDPARSWTSAPILTVYAERAIMARARTSPSVAKLPNPDCNSQWRSDRRFAQAAATAARNFAPPKARHASCNPTVAQLATRPFCRA